MIRLLAERHRPTAAVLGDREARRADAASRLAAASAGWRRDTRSSAATPPSPQPYALLFGASLAGGLLQRRQPRAARAGTALAAGSAIAARARGRPARDAAVRRCSAREPERERGRRASPPPEPRAGASASCGHLDTTRSGADLPSRGRAAPRDSSCRSRLSRRSLLAAGPLLRRLPGGRALARRRARRDGLLARDAGRARAARRGRPGASDNASGAAVAMQLAAECAAAPLAHTEVDLLITSCEESGMLGAQAYARRHGCARPRRTFINFDTVGGAAPLTYILREGSATVNRPASPRLVEHARGDRRSAGPSSASRPARTTPGPADRRDADARAGVGGGHAARAGRHDSQLPLADRHLREHRPAHRRAGARDRARAAARLDAEVRRAPPPAASGRDGRSAVSTADTVHGCCAASTATAPPRYAPPLGRAHVPWASATPPSRGHTLGRLGRVVHTAAAGTRENRNTRRRGRAVPGVGRVAVGLGRRLVELVGAQRSRTRATRRRRSRSSARRSGLNRGRWNARDFFVVLVPEHRFVRLGRGPDRTHVLHTKLQGPARFRMK